MARDPLDGEEDRLTRYVLDMLSRWLSRVTDAVLAGFRMAGISPDPTGVYATIPIWTADVDKFARELEPAQRIGWNGVDLRSAPMPFPSSDSFIQAQLAHTRNLLVNIPNEVYELIFAELSEGVNAGEGVPQLAKRIEKVLNVSGSDRWPNRAKVIAVTEVNRAGNSAALAAAYRAESMEGVRMAKKWMDSHDQRVRPDHQDADGQQVSLDQPFQVGQSLLQYPGDPVGLPADVIGCRCSLVVVEASP